jgi:HEPN domain-containing protein
MKKTAVEFYRKNLMELMSTRSTYFKTEPEIFEQAKEMEKQQIKDAYISGMYDAHSKTSIDYYKENYETTV